MSAKLRRSQYCYAKSWKSRELEISRDSSLDRNLIVFCTYITLCSTNDFLLFFFVEIRSLNTTKLAHIYIEYRDEIHILQSCKARLQYNLLQIKVVLTTFYLIEIFVYCCRNSIEISLIFYFFKIHEIFSIVYI